MTKRLLGTAGAVLLALIVGCGGASVRTYSQPPSGERRYGQVKKVAVLPFDSVVEGAQAPRLTGDVFLQELLTRGTFESVEEPRYVAELMKKLKLRNTENLDREIVRKMGEELRAQALFLGDLLVFGQEENSEAVEFMLQVTLIDSQSGDILWSGRTFAQSNTTMGQVLGVSEGPSLHEVATTGIRRIVGRFDREFRAAREAEVKRLLEAAKAQGVAEEVEVPPEEAAPEAAPEITPEGEAEEILLDVKPK